MTGELSIKGYIIVFAAALAAFGIQFTISVPSTLAVGLDSNWGSYSEKEQNPDRDAAKRKIAAKDYGKVIIHSQKYITENPKNADAYSYMGYALRNMEKPKESGVAYKKALTINPKHLGALEYQGQLYLKLGEVEKAKANLAKLDSLCLFGCDEYTKLKNAIFTHNGK